MADTNVVTALKAKREAIRKAIIEYEEKLKEARFDFIAITDALKVFGEKPGSYRAGKYQKSYSGGGAYREPCSTGSEKPKTALIPFSS